MLSPPGHLLSRAVTAQQLMYPPSEIRDHEECGHSEHGPIKDRAASSDSLLGNRLSLSTSRRSLNTYGKCAGWRAPGAAIGVGVDHHDLVVPGRCLQRRIAGGVQSAGL
jgi:hypothetical protein